MRRPATPLAIEEMDIPGFDDLFGAMHLNHPTSNMPENRARRPGAFTRSRSSSSHSPMRGFFGHPTPLQDMMWDRRYYGPGPSRSPFPTGRVEELGDYDIPRSVSAHGMDYQDPHANGYSKPPLPYTPERRQSFEQAAASMYAALVTANQECRSIEKSFMDDVRNIMRWLPSSYMDSLWVIRVGWDGSPVKDTTKPGLTKPDATAVSYDAVVRRFSTALQGMKSSAPPANAPDSGQAFSWEVLRTTMRKLQISLEAIEELFQLTRNRRDRMPLLLHELASAIHLLESVRDVWENSNTRAGASKGKGRAEATPGPSTNRDFEWTDFGGCGGNPTGPI